MRGREHWLSVANADNPDDLREEILTGFKSGKPFTPYVPTIAVPAHVDVVLDFGCGLGRNFPYLATIARRITGFDLPPMIEKCRTLAPMSVDLLTSDWDEVKRRRLDLIFTTLVLQHLEPETCRSLLVDFARMAPAVYLLTRASSDFDTSVLEMIKATALFDAGPCVEVEHDERTHQLRVLGTHSFDELVRSGASGHYEVLLRARNGGRPA